MYLEHRYSEMRVHLGRFYLWWVWNRPCPRRLVASAVWVLTCIDWSLRDPGHKMAPSSALVFRALPFCHFSCSEGARISGARNGGLSQKLCRLCVFQKLCCFCTLLAHPLQSMSWPAQNGLRGTRLELTYLFISSLTKWSLSRELFSFHEYVGFLLFLFLLKSSLNSCWSEKMQMITWGLFCAWICGPFWKGYVRTWEEGKFFCFGMKSSLDIWYPLDS